MAPPVTHLLLGLELEVAGGADEELLDDRIGGACRQTQGPAQERWVYDMMRVITLLKWHALTDVGSRIWEELGFACLTT